MNPLLMMGAQLIAKNLEKERARKQLYRETVAEGARKLGGDMTNTNLMRAQHAIDQSPVDYGQILSLFGRKDEDEFDEDYGLLSRQNYGKP